MLLIDLIIAADGRISDGDPYMWECYGPNARFIEFVDINGDHFCQGIYDTKTFEIYEVSLDKPNSDASFRYINPDYKKAYYLECEKNDIDPNNAFDDINYTNVETEELILEYVEDMANATYNKIPDFATTKGGKVSVPIDLTDDELFRLMTMAHEQDITLNQLVENILQSEIDRIKEEEQLVLEMPGTMGSAKITFKE